MPDGLRATLERATAWYLAGRTDDAARACRDVLALTPSEPTALHILGLVAHRNGRHHEAIELISRALASGAGDAQMLNNLGEAYRLAGRLADAIDCYRRAIALEPRRAYAWFNQGIAHSTSGQFADAEACYRQALEADSRHAGAAVNLGNLLKARGELDAAEAMYCQALAASPELALAHGNLGALYLDRSEWIQAAQCFERALALQPGAPGIAAQLLACRQQLCDWRGLGSLARTVLEELKQGAVVPPMGLLALPDFGPEEQRLCARTWAAQRLEPIARANPARALPLRSAKKIRVGYLSADFREHAISYLAAEVFELHDRRRFETFAYSYGPDDASPMRNRMIAAFDRFHDVRPLSAEAVARRIRADGIELLIDLMGYSGNGRPEILAFRPAPIQAQFLGYPGTMGTRLVDYLIADRFVVPPESCAFYDESVVRLPHCYQPNDRRRPVGLAPSREQAGLPDRGFVFCSFNQTYKLTPEVFELWMRLLRATPGSVLWLLESTPRASDNLRREAAARAVDASRLVFASKLPLAPHLGRLALADLVLDNWPYNGHTTTSDALWVGVPVLTLPGRTFASRVAGSLLHALGLPELVAQSARDYEARALALAADGAALSALKAKVARQREISPLFDTVRFVRDLEATYLAMRDASRERLAEPEANSPSPRSA